MARALILALAAGGLMGLASGAVAQPPKPAPAAAVGFSETPAQRDARMAWWREARFGMFIHWGVYAQFAGDYQGKRVPGAGEWIMQDGKIPVSEYEKMAKNFNPVKYDAKEWVKVAKDAGIKYIVITSKHHDGFDLWDAKGTDWDVTRTPYGKDLLMPLKQACDQAGIKFGLYHSIMDWHHADYKPRRAWNDLAIAGGHEPDFEKFVPYLHGQVTEIIQRFDPAVLWFDGEWEETWTVERGEALEALVRRAKPNIIVNNRVGKSRSDMAGVDKAGVKRAGDYGTPEQEIPARGIPGYDWETCMTMNDTWGFVREDLNWKSSETLIRNLVDIASKGGNYLLNVGPTPEGEIPAASVERLKAMGGWMKVNGEAIYGTTAGPFNRLAWGRATVKQKGTSATLYLHVFDWPKDGVLRVPGLKNKVTGARLLAAPGTALAAKTVANGVEVQLPAKAPDAIASVVVLEVQGVPEAVDVPILPGADGIVMLKAADATVKGVSAHYESSADKDCIGYWTDAKDKVAWEFQVGAAGKYKVEAVVACQGSDAGGTYVVKCAGQEFRAAVPDTGGWSKFVPAELGTLEIAKAGRFELLVEVVDKPHGAMMNLRSIRLVPAK